MANNTKNACRMPKIAMYRKDAKCQRLMNSNSISPSCAGQLPVQKKVHGPQDCPLLLKSRSVQALRRVGDDPRGHHVVGRSPAKESSLGRVDAPGESTSLVMGDPQNGWFIENPKIKSNGWMINGVPP